MTPDDRRMARIAEQNLTDLVGDEVATVKAQAWHSWFEQRIAWMIENRFEKLMSILYRIDVDEEAAKDALAEKQTSDAAKRIASLLLEREREKVATRFRHKGIERNSEG